jgi:hypothetical protein
MRMQISQALPTKELSPLRFYHMNFIPLNIKTWKDQRGICSKHAIFSPQLSAPCHSEHRGRATAQHLGFSFQEDPENDTHTQPVSIKFVINLIPGSFGKNTFEVKSQCPFTELLIRNLLYSLFQVIVGCS